MMADYWSGLDILANPFSLCAKGHASLPGCQVSGTFGSMTGGFRRSGVVL